MPSPFLLQFDAIQVSWKLPISGAALSAPYMYPWVPMFRVTLKSWLTTRKTPSSPCSENALCYRSSPNWRFARTKNSSGHSWRGHEA